MSRRLLALPFVLLATVAGFAVAAAAQRTNLDDVLDRASAYVLAYEKQCAAVVAEELYIQNLEPAAPRQPAGGVVGDARPADGKRFWDNVQTGSRERAPAGPRHRELVSDVLLVQLPDETWFGFRDVAAVDGRPVRDRAERVQALFLKSRADLRKVQEESSRYNIGPVRRTMNVPTFALAFLHPALRDRFNLVQAGEEAIEGTRALIVSFAERVHPTIINDGRGHDIASNGRFWIDPATGRVLRTHLLAGDDASEVRAEAVVTYRPHPEWALLLPAEMRESYDQPARPDAYRLVCTATYSKFRRFDVQVDEQIKVPKRPE